MKKLFFAVTLVLAFALPLFATPLDCMFSGGTWYDGRCIYPLIVPAPTSIVRDELVDGELDGAFLSLGEDSYNTVLAQYEHMLVKTQYNLKFTEPVNISLCIGTPGEDGFLVYIDEQGNFTLQPVWTYWNKTLIPAQTFLPQVLVGDVFSWYQGLLFVGAEVRSYNNPQYYWIQYYWVYIANPTLEEGIK